MTDRWRGRRLAGLATVVLAAAALSGSVAASTAAPRWVVVRDAAGVELARAALPPDGAFSLRYRNSLYGSIAEERFRAAGDHLDLVGLAAEELAVLEEYYGAVGATRTRAGLPWRIAVERPSVPLPLRVQATALGERTLLTSGDPIGLWQLVAGHPSTLVVLTIEGPG